MCLRISYKKKKYENVFLRLPKFLNGSGHEMNIFLKAF